MYGKGRLRHIQFNVTSHISAVAMKTLSVITLLSNYYDKQFGNYKEIAEHTHIST